jgi:hypothetical protein
MSDKHLRKLHERINEIERPSSVDEIARRAWLKVAQLRVERCKDGLGRDIKPNTFHNITEEEMDVIFKDVPKASPEEMYQYLKKEYYFHNSSWEMQKDDYDGHGCTEKGCIPECKFYDKEGTLEPGEGFE